MQYSEAHSHAKQWKQFFRSFEKIEEVLDVAAKAERSLNEAQARKIVVDRELAALTNDVILRKAELKEADDAFESRKALGEQEATSLAGRINELVRDIKSRREVEKAEASDREEATKAKADADRAVVAQEINALKEQKAKAEQELAQTKSVHAAFLKQIGAD